MSSTSSSLFYSILLTEPSDLVMVYERCFSKSESCWMLWSDMWCSVGLLILIKVLVCRGKKGMEEYWLLPSSNEL